MPPFACEGVRTRETSGESWRTLLISDARKRLSALLFSLCSQVRPGRPDRLPLFLSRDTRSGSFSPYQARPNATVTNSLKGLRTHFSRLSSLARPERMRMYVFMFPPRRDHDVFCFRARERKVVRHTERKRKMYIQNISEERIIPDLIFRD